MRYWTIRLKVEEDIKEKIENLEFTFFVSFLSSELFSQTFYLFPSTFSSIFFSQFFVKCWLAQLFIPKAEVFWLIRHTYHMACTTHAHTRVFLSLVSNGTYVMTSQFNWSNYTPTSLIVIKFK